MKKIIFGIFAHPDDEAFGPSGTLLLETKAGNDVHLITLTAGEAGANPDNHDDLAAVRLQEWREAGTLIGAASMTCLGYKDGQLNNIAMIEIQQTILHHIKEIISQETEPFSIELMSIDSNGITGHIDHIVASRSACYVFCKLQETNNHITKLRLACLPQSQLPTPSTDWLYMDSGRSNDEIGETIDARLYRDEIIAIMRCHHSQRADLKNHLDTRGDLIGLNYFMIKT